LCEDLEFHNLHISSTQLCVDKNVEDQGHRRFVLIPKNQSAEIFGVMELGSHNLRMEVNKEPCNSSHYPFKIVPYVEMYVAREFN
jgi:hypothetical protein